MSEHSRTVKILASLIASMTIGGGLLMLLDNQTPTAGAFSLAGYTRLNSIEKVVLDISPGRKNIWDKIEVSFTGGSSDDLAVIAQKAGLNAKEDLNFHFLVCSGCSETDGLIRSTQRWNRQRPALQGPNWYGSRQTIRIMVVGDSEENPASDAQLKRVAGLVSLLARRFEISKDNIALPENWRM